MILKQSRQVHGHPRHTSLGDIEDNYAHSNVTALSLQLAIKY